MTLPAKSSVPLAPASSVLLAPASRAPYELVAEQVPDIIISIKPKYVDLIFAGCKRVELRKRGAWICPGTRILIYATLPIGALVGEARICFRELLPIELLWKRHGAQAAIERKSFDDYYAGADEGIALGLQLATRYSEPVSLAALRAAGDGFRPPQSYMRAPSFVAGIANELRTRCR